MSDAPARTRKSSVRGGSAANKSAVVATLFKRDEASGETGEYLQALRAYESRALVDPFINIFSVGGGSMAIISPDYNPFSIIKLPNESSVLRQCVDAMVTNICSFGYRLEYIGEKGQEESKPAQREKERIESLLEQPNGEYTVTELRERLRRDIETFGYGFVECGRDKTGQIIFLNQVPAHTIRMTAKLNELVPVTTYLKRDGKLLKVTVHRQFRRFVQQVGARTIYFKEFGDPRQMDPTTGLENAGLAIQDAATEIFLFSLYSPGSPYGLPRWIGTLPSIMGIRESELTNLQFFKDNAIPAMAILVSGGALSDDTMSNLENHFTAARGRGSMNRVLVLEASGDEESAPVEGQIPSPKLDIKPLSSQRQTDGQFKEYEEASERKVRASFRLPPLFVGRADDYSHASADASMVMADAQVFGPERSKEDDIWNANFLTVDGLPLQYWRMRTNPPRLVSADSILTALETLDNLGAVTPNIAIGIANELFDLALTPVDAEWGNYPFPLVMQLALAGNLDGMQEIMIVPDAIERGLANAEKLTEDASVPDDQKSPATKDPKTSNKPPKAGAKDPKPSPAEAGPGTETSSKSDKQMEARRKAAKILTYSFRSVAERGNDIPNPMAYKARHRVRKDAPKVVLA